MIKEREYSTESLVLSGLVFWGAICIAILVLTIWFIDIYMMPIDIRHLLVVVLVYVCLITYGSSTKIAVRQSSDSDE